MSITIERNERGQEVFFQNGEYWRRTTIDDQDGVMISYKDCCTA